MRTNQTVGIRNRKVSLKLYVVTVIALSILFTSILANSYFGQTASALPQSLDIEIQPRDAKVPANVTVTFSVLVRNGTVPYTFKWMCNGSIVGSQQVVEFMPFPTPSEQILTLTVEVVDSLGNRGFDATTIRDPASISVYLDDLPTQVTYTIKSDGTNFWAIRYDGYKATEGTDAYVVINYAITQANASGGGTVLICSMRASPYYYTINSPIILKSNVRLTGEGWQRTTLRAKNALNAPVIKISGATVRVEVDNLQIDGNMDNQGTPNDQINGIQLCYTGTISWFSVHDLYVHDCLQSGIYVASSTENDCHGHIYDCIIDYCGANGITVGGSSDIVLNCAIENVYVSRCSDVGISIFGRYCLISNCVATACQGALGKGSANSGWSFGIEGGSDNTIVSCVAQDCDVGVGIGGANVIRIYIVNLKAIEIDSDGVYIWQQGNYTVIDGIDAYHVIRMVNFEGTLTYTTIGTNSTIMNCVGHQVTLGVYIPKSGTSNVFIANNDFWGCTDDIDNSGTNTVFGSNRWKDGTYDTTPPA